MLTEKTDKREGGGKRGGAAGATARATASDMIAAQTATRAATNSETGRPQRAPLARWGYNRRAQDLPVGRRRKATSVMMDEERGEQACQVIRGRVSSGSASIVSVTST